LDNSKTARERIRADSFVLRKLSKAGAARYLSIGTILPKEWEAVKVYVVSQDATTYVLRLEQIL